MAELTRRYIVMQMAVEAPFDIADPDAPFVLKPWKDPAALQALMTYRQHCYAELARELDVWIGAIMAGPKTRGGVGSRNELMAPFRSKPAAAATSKAKSKAIGSKPKKKKPKRRA